ncbi:MAG: energy-coupled thiamine transporter ThiT [Oscillospiraceae bacterium]|nr:energy-coupled thiamine transporter ThiT [Oscillospiraceae bacterium]
MKNKKTLILVESAIFLGLAIALSFVKIIKMPWGGSVTLLSMLPVALISIRHGVKWGLPVAFLYSAVHFFTDLGEVMTWSLTPAVFTGMIFLDYLAAFSVLGLAGVFRRKGFEGQCLGVALAVTLRFASHFLSGIILWGEFAAYYDWSQGSVPLYSLIYNGAYMFPEIIFTTIGAVVLLKAPYVRKLFTVSLPSPNSAE